MRYTGGDNKLLRFGCVIVDNTLRRKGYEKQMLILVLKYEFKTLKSFFMKIVLIDKLQFAFFKLLIKNYFKW